MKEVSRYPQSHVKEVSRELCFLRGNQRVYPEPCEGGK